MAKTGADGVLLTNWDKPRDPKSALSYLVLDGAHAAGSGLGVPEQVAQGLTPRAYLYTDRPAYRPGQEVASPRRRPRGQGRPVLDARGRDVQAGSHRQPRPAVLDAAGHALGVRHASSELPARLAARPWARIASALYQPGKSEFSGQFEVQAYQLEKIDLEVRPAADGLLPRRDGQGRGLSHDISTARRWPAGRSRSSCPTAGTSAGRPTRPASYTFEFPTEGFAEAQALRLVAALPQDNVAAGGARDAGRARL